jgi:IS5 family transposase
LYDSAAMRSFAGIDLGSEAAPHETTVCKFRHGEHHSSSVRSSEVGSPNATHGCF